MGMVKTIAIIQYIVNFPYSSVVQSLLVKFVKPRPADYGMQLDYLATDTWR